MDVRQLVCVNNISDGLIHDDCCSKPSTVQVKEKTYFTPCYYTPQRGKMKQSYNLRLKDVSSKPA